MLHSPHYLGFRSPQRESECVWVGGWVVVYFELNLLTFFHLLTSRIKIWICSGIAFPAFACLFLAIDQNESKLLANSACVQGVCCMECSHGEPTPRRFARCTLYPDHSRRSHCGATRHWTCGHCLPPWSRRRRLPRQHVRTPVDPSTSWCFILPPILGHQESAHSALGCHCELEAHSQNNSWALLTNCLMFKSSINLSLAIDHRCICI